MTDTMKRDDRLLNHDNAVNEWAKTRGCVSGWGKELGTGEIKRGRGVIFSLAAPPRTPTGMNGLLNLLGTERARSICEFCLYLLPYKEIFALRLLSFLTTPLSPNSLRQTPATRTTHNQASNANQTNLTVSLVCRSDLIADNSAHSILFYSRPSASPHP